MKYWMLICVALAVYAQPVESQESVKVSSPGEDAKALAGYVEFNLSGALEGRKPNVSVQLEGVMIKMVAAAANEAKSPVAVLLEELKLVQVQVYEDIAELYQVVRPIGEQVIVDLKQNGWEQVVSVPEDTDAVDVLVKSSGDLILGLVILVMEEEELVFVNLAGDISPEVMGGLLGKLGAGVLTGEVDLEALLSGGWEFEEAEVEETGGRATGEATPKQEDDSAH